MTHHTGATCLTAAIPEGIALPSQTPYADRGNSDAADATKPWFFSHVDNSARSPLVESQTLVMPTALGPPPPLI